MSNDRPNRSEAITVKVYTNFGPLYFHIEHHNGQPTCMRLSRPQKLDGSSISDLLDFVCEGVTQGFDYLNGK